MKFLSNLALISICFSFCDGKIDAVEYRKSKEKWLQAGSVIQQYAWPFKDAFTNFLHDVLADENINITSSCRYDLDTFATGLEGMSTDAMSIFDSFGHVPSGFTKDRFVDFGHYEQCLQSNLNGTTTRYVVLKVVLPLPSDQRILKFDHDSVDQTRPPWIIEYSKKIGFFHFWDVLVSICIPSSCSEQDVTEVINNNLVERTIAPIKLSVYNSETLDEDPLASVQYPVLRRISRLVLFSLILLTILSTVICHVLPIDKDSIIAHFNIASNVKSLTSPSRDHYVGFNVFKVVYLFSAIYTHCYTGIIPGLWPYYHQVTIHAYETDFKYGAQYENFAICLNFVVSGSLAVMSVVPHLKKRYVSLVEAVFLRALRTIPIILAVMLVMFSFPLTSPGYGPIMKSAQVNVTANCVKNGWKDLLFISNYVPPNEACSTINWFMSTDMQLFALAYILITIMVSRPKLAFCGTIGFLLFGGLVNFAYLTMKNIQPVFFTPSNDFSTSIRGFTEVQFHSISYISPYGVGLLLGFLQVNRIAVPPTFYKWIIGLSLMTCVGVTSLLVTMYDVTDGFRSNYSRFHEVLLGATLRPIFCLGLAGILYVVYISSLKKEDEDENAKKPEEWMIMRYLKDRQWIPFLARLSFTTFMVHPLVLFFVAGSATRTVDFSEIDFLAKSCLVSILSIILGLVLHLTVEAPFLNILKSALTKGSQSKKSVKSD